MPAFKAMLEDEELREVIFIVFNPGYSSLNSFFCIGGSAWALASNCETDGSPLAHKNRHHQRHDDRRRARLQAHRPTHPGGRLQSMAALDGLFRLGPQDPYQSQTDKPARKAFHHQERQDREWLSLKVGILVAPHSPAWRGYFSIRTNSRCPFPLLLLHNQGWHGGKEGSWQYSSIASQTPFYALQALPRSSCSGRYCDF